MNLKFWKNKIVLVTGHTGFKGSWLSLWLQQLGTRVIGYALPAPTKPSLFELSQVKNNMISLEKDIRDFNMVLATLKKYQPEIIIHMAAQALVRQSYENPVATYETNVIGTVCLLEAVRRTKSVKAVINVTSDKCYENRDWIWGYRESDPLGGYDPYSSSKACSEIITSALRNSFFPVDQYLQHGIAVASARAGNVIGGGDWAKDRLVPDCIKAWLKGRIVSIRYPRAVRPWQHVLEPLKGYMLLAEKLYEDGPSFSEAWNFGPDESSSKSVEHVVSQLASLWGKGARYKIKQGEHPHEANYLKLDCSKAKTKLGWTPQWTFETALQKTIDWYSLYKKAPRNIREETLKQIYSYMDG